MTVQMKRREFIAFLASAAAWDNSARAQQQSPPMIAILGSGAADSPASLGQMRLLDSGMRELGLVAGRDYVFKTWWADGAAGHFPALAEELLSQRPAAVVVFTIAAVKAVQERSRTVPIVMSGMNDPVAAGLVASLARPGGNVTGTANMAEDVMLKIVEMLREAMPGLRRLAAMTNPTNPSNGPMIDVLQRHGAAAGLSIVTVGAASPADLDTAFAEIARRRPDALYLVTDNILLALSSDIVARALAQRIPTFGNFALNFARSGALFGYSRDPKEGFQSVARLLKKILGGASPADLPVEQPTRFTLQINLKTARALGIAVPPTLITIADEVFE